MHVDAKLSFLYFGKNIPLLSGQKLKIFASKGMFLFVLDRKIQSNKRTFIISYETDAAHISRSIQFSVKFLFSFSTRSALENSKHYDYCAIRTNEFVI